MSDSDDDSSDSSNDFTGITPNDELTASFFTIKPATKTNLNLKEDSSEDESSDNDNFTNVPENNGIELFSEVVKNLEASQKTYINDEKQHSSNDNLQNIKTVNVKKNNISDEINAVLLQGETGIHALPENDEDTDNEEKKEEDVKRPDDYTIPKEGIKITLPGTSVFKKKTSSKKESDLAAILRRKLKTNQIIIEKAARLCWLAHGFYLNHQANDPEIMSTVVSLVSKHNYPKNNFDLTYLTKFTKWFRNMFTIEPGDNEVVINKETLLKRIAEKKIFNYRELIILYVAILRAIGLHCRLILSLNPPLVKTYNELLPKTSTAKKNDKIKEEPKESKTKAKLSKGKKSTDSKKDLKNENIIQNSENARRNANEEAKKKAAEILRSKYSYNKKNKDKVNNISIQDSASTSKDIKATSTSSKKGNIDVSPRRLRPRKTHVASAVNKPQDNTQTNSKNNQPETQKSRRRSESSSFDSNSEEEEEEEKLFSKPKRKRSNNNKAVTTSNEKNKKKNQASQDEEEDNDKLKKRQDVWAEVYVESKGCWICVNVMDSNVDCVTEIYKKASKPVLYVIAYNSEGLIKDVTRRYCPQWLSVTRKQRIDEKWWIETLTYWQEKETAISKQEDELLLQKELEQPLPKTVSECKGHPLYVLIRHLLKYEALYPPDCVPLGHLKTGEAIYSRYCVHTLRSRETWLKHARVVKPKQDAYKIVKALPKYDKLSGMKIKDSALELFGEWQTTEYEPPEAKDGIVPRNAFGNVDLFKKCMLPKGTVHINLPGLNRIARKLNIDCATAVVGFNFGCMGAVPAIEGCVVCAEYEDVLREAWETEQVEAAKRATEKREKRIYGNWKKLIKGLLIKEKLSQKYEFQEESKTDQSNKRPKQRKGTVKKSKT
ncbi:DNA repair protein complementing XP-C cells [Linepithema humile]|uniref:DNA repair protein complementing XP-C cells n=1 Tax=Linepithema humile TaxID=83485 RepID=UPI0006233386|nr:PREDICTED: DNA repair protein complementing XP-C cells homolog [Linepithema humile]